MAFGRPSFFSIGKIKYIFSALLFGAVFLVWYAVFAEDRNVLTVAFLDVGQGDAIFIQAPNNNQVLLDGGPNKSVLRQLSKIMPFYDRSIDALIMSHPDSDHIGGLADVLKRFTTTLAIEPGVSADSALYEEFWKSAEEKDAARILARRGMKITLDQEAGVYLFILFPDRDVSRMDTNDASIIAKLVYGNTSFLFTGDSPEKMEKYMASIAPESLDVDVLKLGHHGSKTSNSETLLGFSTPEYAVVSVGADNRYGHPNKEVLERLADFEIPVLRTDELGTIKFQSNGENITIE